MRNKWIRSIALLVLAATLISLLGIGAFAAGGEDSAAADSSEASGTPTTETVPSDGDASETPASFTVTFCGYNGKEIYKIENHAANTPLSQEELTALDAALPTGGIAYWYGSGVGYEADSLEGTLIVGNAVFYAAWKVTYYDPFYGEIATEIVKAGEKPVAVPQKTTDDVAITGWTMGAQEADKDASADPAQTAITGDTSFVCTRAVNPTISYTVSFYDYDGTKLSTVTTEGGIIDPDLIPASAYLKGESVNGWAKVYDPDDLVDGIDPDNLGEVFDLSTHNIMYDCAFIAAWKVGYVYESDEGKTEYAKVLVLDGEKPAYVPDIIFETKETVYGWLNAAGELVDPSEQVISSNVEFTALLTPALVTPTLNTSDSVAYVNGIAQKDKTIYTFEPDSALTRAQAAQLIYGLLNETGKGLIDVTFSDVSATSWYSEPVYCLASYGLLNGMGDGLFEPKRGITRAEFVQLICNICGTEEITTASPFADVTKTTAWYYDSIMTAYQNGWITGYTQSDGTVRFERQRTITRAEAVTIINRVLGRTPDSSDKARINSYDWRLFIDLSDSHWAYYEIMEAATGCGSTIPSTGLSAGRTTLKQNGSSSYYFVNDDGQFVLAKAGVNVMSDGKSYYFASDGIAAPIYSEGLFSDGTDLYLLASDGSVIREPKSGYDTRVYEYKSHMYYIQEDGTLLQNEKFGYLYFGSNGAYTSGDKVLDTWVNNFISSHKIIDNNKTQENKLLAAYVAMRDYPLEVHGDGSQGYARYNFEGYSHQEHASYFFEYAKGTCEDWAYAMTYLAQRVGYDACAAVGKLQGSNNATHVWELIYIRDNWYAFDVEQEWGYMYLHYNPWARSDRDCWKMKYADGQSIYYGYRFDGTTYGDSYAGGRNVWSPYLYGYFTT